MFHKGVLFLARPADKILCPSSVRSSPDTDAVSQRQGQETFGSAASSIVEVFQERGEGQVLLLGLRAVGSEWFPSAFPPELSGSSSSDHLRSRG